MPTPSPLQAGPAEHPPDLPTAPLVSASAAVVVAAAPSLLRQPLALGELAAAARQGCPLAIVAPAGLAFDSLSAGELPPLVPSAAEAAALSYNVVGGVAAQTADQSWGTRPLFLAPCALNVACSAHMCC